MKALLLATAVVAMTLVAACAKRPEPVGSVSPGPPPVAAAPASRAVTGSSPSPPPALQDVHFDTDRSVIRAGELPVIEADARWLRDHPDVTARLEGHADERGTPAHNVALGQSRAAAVRDYLASHGVDGRRLTVASFGEAHPLCTEPTSACLARNRRVHVALAMPPAAPVPHPAPAAATAPVAATAPAPAPPRAPYTGIPARDREVPEHGG